MDILSHTLSGAAVGALAGASHRVSKRGKWALFWIGAAAGALPDIDAVSRRRGFDTLVGQPLGLDATGREIYTGKFWYSHHAITHSLLWCALAFAIVFLIIRRRHSYPWSFRAALTAAAGTLAHVIGDMPTPAGSWGGVALLFPSSTYVGGWGWIWWWNNYDLVLLLFGLNVALLSLSLLTSKNLASRAWLTALAFGTAGLAQIASRPTLFLRERGGRSFGELEAASLEIQRSILPDWLFGAMTWLDGALPMPF